MLLHRLLIVVALLAGLGGRLACADDSQDQADLRQAESDVKKAETAAKEGRYKEAERLAQSALTTQERILGNDNAKIAEPLIILGFVESSLGDYFDAEWSYRREIELAQKALGPDHRSVATPLLLLTHVYNSTVSR